MDVAYVHRQRKEDARHRVVMKCVIGERDFTFLLFINIKPTRRNRKSNGEKGHLLTRHCS